MATNDISEHVLQKRIGTLFAAGYTSPEIITLLVTEGYSLDGESVVQAIQKVFDTWRTVGETVFHVDQDILNYHVFMRHALLKTAISMSQLRTALAILESLADLQGVEKVSNANLTPIQIMLVEHEGEGPIVVHDACDQSIDSTPGNTKETEL